MARTFEITIDPDGFVPPSSAHADRGVVQNRSYLGFDDTTVESMYSKAVQMPAAYSGGTLKADILYAAASATSGNFNFEVLVEAITAADAVDTDSASSFDTANDGVQTVPGTAGYLGLLTITLSNKDSVAVGDMLRIQLRRDATDGTNDTATGDARVYSVTIYEEV